MIQNINDINLNKSINDFNEIIEEKYLNKKFEKIIKIYSNIMNKNINECSNLNNNNSVDKANTFENKIIFVTFTFQRNKKQIYMEIDINETFCNAIRILEEVKYN